MSQDILTLSVFVKVFIVSTMCRKKVVELLYKTTDCRNKLDKTLGNKNDTEVVAVLSALCNSCSNLFNDLVQRHVLLLNLF